MKEREQFLKEVGNVYKAAYAATQCKPPRWDIAENSLSQNREVDSLLLLAKISQQRGRWRKADSLLKNARRQASDDPRVILAQARLAYVRWKEEKRALDAKIAIDSYRDYLIRNPNSPYRGEIQASLRELEHGKAGTKCKVAKRNRVSPRNSVSLHDFLT